MTAVQRLVAGDTLSFTTPAPTGADGAVYRPGDGWSLNYRLVLRATATAIALSATTEDDDTFRIAVVASTTALWTPGTYDAAAWVTLGADTYTVEPAFTEVEILRNPRTATSFDGRTLAAKALADARAALAALNAASHSASGVIEVAVGDRRTRYADASEARAGLREDIRFWQQQLDYETNAAAGRVTGPLGRSRQAVPLG
jgi:hypothetical protein